MLVDYHQTRFDARQDVFAFELEEPAGCCWLIFGRKVDVERLLDRLRLIFGRSGALKLSVELLPVGAVRHPAAVCGVLRRHRALFRLLERVVASRVMNLRRPHLVGAVEDWNVDSRLIVEIHCRRHNYLAQRLAHGGLHYGPYRLFVLELYFGFCGVDVDVDGGRVNFDVDEERGVLARLNQAVVSLLHRAAEHGVLHKPAVDEKVLVGIAFAHLGAVGRANVALDARHRCFRLHR